MVVLSATALVFFFWKTSKNEPPVSPSAIQTEVPEPNAKALDLFMNGTVYSDRISMLINQQKEILTQYASEFQVKPYFNSDSFLLPNWRKGSRKAKIACRANEFPSKGEMSLVNFSFEYEDGEWKLDLFGSDPTRLFQMINLLDHPIGVLLAYFKTDEGRSRSSYILEDVVEKNRLKVSTASLNNIPWLEYSLSSISEFEFFENGICRVNAGLKNYRGEEHSQDIILKSMLKKWFIWRKPPDTVLSALKPVETIE